MNAKTTRFKCGTKELMLFAVGLIMSLTPLLAEEPFNITNYLNLQIAICDHPMYMLIDQDRGVPIIGERVPPWGAPDAEAYVQRVKRILIALKKDPEAKVNFEWSACELNELAHRFPDVIQGIREAYQRGQLDFVDGAYSQAHMSTFGSESNWRQFQYGLEVFQQLVGEKIVVYASQEDQLAPQIPQILHDFGYKYMVMPAFPWRLTITKGPFDLLGSPGYYLRKGCEFINASALDGSSVPAYFPTMDPTMHTVHAAWMRDLWGPPPLLLTFPDMEEYHNPLAGWAKPVLLEHALDERFKAAPPRASGRVSTYESYDEGVWAEEYLRANRLAEENAVLAGDLLAMGKLAGHSDENLHAKLGDIWRTILKYEHHDVTWIEVTDLRRQGITNFLYSVKGSRQLMAEVATQLVEKADDSEAVFNGLTHARSALLEVSASQIPGGGGQFQKFGNRYLGFRRLPAGGFKSFALAPDGWTESKERLMPKRITTDYYTVELSKDGLMNQITTSKGENLLVASNYLGGEIRAVIGNQWVNNRSATCRFYDGEVCSILERSGLFGVSAPAKTAPSPGPTWVREGKVGGDLLLRGKSYLSAGGLGTHDDLTVAMWIKPTSLDYPLQALLHSDGWDFGAFHFMLRDDGRLQVAVNGNDPVDTFSVSTLGKSLGKWVHVAVVYNGPTKRVTLYINGKKDSETALKVAVPVTLEDFRMGAWNQEPRFFHGALDDVRIYSTALDDAEIAEIAAGGTAVDSKDLLAWWKLDETSGNEAADTSGNGHPATVTSGEFVASQRRIPLRERYYFFKHQPFIKVELVFNFNGNTIGDMNIEETKLNVYYPTRGGEIYHDIPFGYVPAGDNEQLFATSWLDDSGLVYVNCGTIKLWVHGGVIANTIAWGGRRFDNRLQWGWTNARQYDLRLYDEQKIVYYLIPSGRFDGPAITRAVEDVRTPVYITPGSGQKSFYQIRDPNLAVTSLFKKDGQVWVRGYQMPSATIGLFRDWLIFNTPLKKLNSP